MKRILSLVAALVLAALGGLAVLGYAGAADARAVAGQEAQTVYVTTRTVPAGTPLGAAVEQGMLQRTVFAARSVPAGALLTVNPTLEALVAVSDIAPGEIVLERRFGQQQSGSTALVVPEGKIAVTIELSDPGRVGSFLRPGSSIAVYDTFRARDAEGGDLTPDGTGLGEAGTVNATRVLLPQAVVVAVGDITVAGQVEAVAGDELGGQDEVPTALVTIAVDPADGPRVVHAATTGLLYVALLGNGVEAGDAVVDDRDLFGGTS